MNLKYQKENAKMEKNQFQITALLDAVHCSIDKLRSCTFYAFLTFFS